MSATKNTTQTERPKVAIIGGGFAGITAAWTLKNAPVDVTLIDRANHHLFQPLLYQVATAALSPANITAPIRWLLRKQRNAMVLLGEVDTIDTERRLVGMDGGRHAVAYDYLIVATGTRHSYIGHDEWEKTAPGLKSLADATEIRQRFLRAFEEAEKTDDLKERDALLTFVIVGGGPTGCEMAGVMPEIARRALRGDFRRIDTSKARVILIEAGKRILPTFDESLARQARRDLENLGVEIRTGSPVVRIEPEFVCLDDGTCIPTRTVFWGAGNAASPLAKLLNAPLDRAGRVRVEPDLSVPGHPEIFIAGDLAAVIQKNGKSVPGVAPAAMQEGKAVALNVLHRLYREQTQPFHYRDKGNLAVIGRNRAVAEIGGLKFSGFPAWFLWLFIHILNVASFRNRLIVLFEWGYAYLTFERGTRLILETEQRRLGPTADTKETVGPWPK